MSEHNMTAFALALSFMMALCAVCFVIWLVWSLAWDLFDWRMQNSRRIKNRDLNAHRITPKFTVGKDAK